MNTKFKAIMSAEEATKNTEEYLEEAYRSTENFLIEYIASAIYQTSNEGKSFCTINTNQRCFPQNLTAQKVMDHLASHLCQLGYKAEICGTFRIDISWEEKVDKECEWKDVSF